MLADNSPLNLSQLKWHRCSLTLHALQANHKAHPLSVGEAIVKGITEHAQLQSQLKVIFQWGAERTNQMRLSTNQPIVITIDAFGGQENTLAHWQRVANSYFTEPNPGKFFRIESLTQWQVMQLPTSLKFTPNHGELCLNFTSPLPFKPLKGRSRTWLDNDGLKALITKRIHKLFGISISPPSKSLSVLPYYWYYQQISHSSHSQAGNTKYINGCIGYLYLKGSDEALAEWMPWLQLAEAIGLGNELSFGRGRCRLLVESPSYFDEKLINAGSISRSLTHVIEHYDQSLPELTSINKQFNELEWSSTLADRIQSQQFSPTPFQAFHYQKSLHAKDVIEKLSLTDLVVLTHLRDLLKAPLENSIHAASLGSSKGLNRQQAIEGIQEALDSGYKVNMTADITDFFSGVDIERLWQRINFLIPKHDILLKSLLKTYLYLPVKDDHQPRRKGLAKSSPLSSLLVNLYLDMSEDQPQSLDTQFIRYGDTFFILARDKVSAEALLVSNQKNDSDSRLTVELNNSDVHLNDENCSFLDVDFNHLNSQEIQPNLGFDSIRKALYITEPFTFLGIDGDTLEVRKKEDILGRFPLKRISEVLTLAPTSWSSALVAKCSEHSIPMVMANANGRAIATLAADSAHRYDIAYRHANHFYSMSDDEKLSVAIGIGQAKLSNTLSFMRQRYVSGLNRSIAKIEQYFDQMSLVSDVFTLRGLEGASAKLYFSHFNEWITNKDFVWTGRHKRAHDPINTMLNFGYHLLFTRLTVLVKGAGLNPYLSFLHEQTDRYESLVSDIQEVFRVYIDRLIIRLINLNMIKITDFTRNDLGLWLNAKGKETFLTAFSYELDRRPSANKLSLNEAMALQVHKWVEFLIEQKTLQMYQWETK